METTIVATVSLVWCLGALVATVAWIVGSVRADRIVASMAREIRAQHVASVQARIPHSTYRVIATTAAEMSAYRAAWHAAREAAQTGHAGQSARSLPSETTLAIWAAQHLGLRAPSEVAPTVIGVEATASALALCATIGTELDDLATMATAHGVTLDTVATLGSVSETARTELYIPGKRAARTMRAPTVNAPRSVAA